MTDSFIDRLTTFYDTRELVDIFEIEPDEFLQMIREVFPEKYEENIYKIAGMGDEDE